MPCLRGSIIPLLPLPQEQASHRPQYFTRMAPVVLTVSGSAYENTAKAAHRVPTGQPPHWTEHPVNQRNTIAHKAPFNRVSVTALTHCTVGPCSLASWSRWRRSAVYSSGMQYPKASSSSSSLILYSPSSLASGAKTYKRHNNLAALLGRPRTPHLTRQGLGERKGQTQIVLKSCQGFPRMPGAAMLPVNVQFNSAHPAESLIACRL